MRMEEWHPLAERMMIIPIHIESRVAGCGVRAVGITNTLYHVF